MSEQEIPNLVSRKEWGALPSRGTLEPLKKMPLKFIRIFRESNTEHCTTQEECIRVIRKLQEKQMTEDNLADIHYNFLIGEDGNVYEGRGWDAKPAEDKRLYVFEDKYIEIMLLGYHKLKLHSHPIYERTWHVINCGVQRGIIQKDFHIIWDIDFVK